MILRRKVHIGSGLRTPDNKKFVKISWMAGHEVGAKTRVFYAVGKVRGSDEYYETLCEEWDHDAWLKKYPTTYMKWLKHLFWKTDENNTPMPPDKGKLPQKHGGGVVEAGSVDDVPPGWPHRLHRDDKASVVSYNLNNGTWCSSPFVIVYGGFV